LFLPVLYEYTLFNFLFMKLIPQTVLILCLILTSSNIIFAQVKTIHVYVALCDNMYQGIVPVNEELGNGQSPRNNLYWGAAYGVKSFFRYIDDDWQLVKTLESSNPHILDRILFKHINEDIYMLAEAYDGKYIKECITDFLSAVNNHNEVEVQHMSQGLKFGGGADLIAYIGHDGLMDFNLNLAFTLNKMKPKDVIVLACFSKEFFAPHLQEARANPILWTTNLMAPEAYTLEAAIDGWILNESGKEIEERAAQAYNRYQKCGIIGARSLFTSGF